MATDKPCSGCPWLRENQTPAAIENSPLDGQGVHWYDHENLKKHWNHVKDGGMMPCHATDPHAILYGGHGVPRSCETRICVGLTTLASREVHAFMVAGTNYQQYKKKNRGIRMSLHGLASWASRLVYTGAKFLIGDREMVMPSVGEDDRVTVPWKDSLHN